MRRLLALVAAAVALTGAPAGAAQEGELVLVADGPSYASVTVSRATSLDLANATVSAPEYAALAIVRPGGQITAFGYRAPGFEQVPFGRNEPHQLQRGLSYVRLLTRGRTTIRIPAPGLGGRMTLRLTRRMAGAVAEFRPLGGLVGPNASEIPFPTGRRRMLVLHGALLEYVAGAEQGVEMCVVDASSGQCMKVLTPVSPGVSPGRLQVAELFDPEPAARATYRSTLVGVPAKPGRHYVLGLPLE